MLNFSEAFKIYVDGIEMKNVVSLQISIDRKNTGDEYNKVTLYEDRQGHVRVHTIELGGIHFEAIKTDVQGDAVQSAD